MAVRGGPRPAARQLSIRRRRVEVPSVDRVQMLDAREASATCSLTCFQKTTRRDLEAALWQLHREGMKSLVIDLRGNPGGLLITAVEVVELFVDHGVIVSTRGRSAQEDFTYTSHGQATWQTPLVVLIDQDSASAAEIFAGAIRDHHRGTLVGVRSFGKGSVQGIFPLESSEAGLRLTTAKFYSPDGHPYARVGVEPDVQVRQAARPIDGATAATASRDRRHDQRGAGRSRPQPLAAAVGRFYRGGAVPRLAQPWHAARPTLQLRRLDAEVLDPEQAGEGVAAGGEGLRPAFPAIDDGHDLGHLQPVGLDALDRLPATSRRW